ncbi:folate-sensitive fragile site protein Fra10Ac1-domain-containing protein [Mycena belliarum]|uniref:Folate-sensitive fragile site protein Fra10Ac1-domain-containing protein n=1 Tax=Mycena belliarum TaxID=1033014 RepID=A0AAD6TYA2_9AGAR|nr:folate-sensitive fragile site protein Fra10Ac1-domain-containing protein [Mycena belliae]
MALYPSSSSSKSAPTPGKTEFEILKASHKFLREEGDGAPRSWDEQLATKYYDSLFREYAVCDLKHYKSGNFALRWRTEAEVLAGAGETSCGNTRCRHHDPASRPARTPLSTLELPFTYSEHGAAKSALVKAVLCEKCLGKLMWTRRKEKERLAPGADAGGDRSSPKEGLVLDAADERGSERRKRPREVDDGGREVRRRRRDSRSRSPRPAAHRQDGTERPRRRSPTR